MRDILKKMLGIRTTAASAAATANGDAALKRGGQVVVEMLLILPVFLTIIFTIMEMGYLAFWVIVVNHATYECARIGAMLGTGTDGSLRSSVDSEMQKFMSRMIKTARVRGVTEQTLFDPQGKVMNSDLVVTGSYDVQLVFPISNILLARPRGTGMRTIEAIVRMPIERPLFR